MLRRQISDDLRVPRRNILRSGDTKTGKMPDGLMESLKPEAVSDLFADLKMLK